MKRALPTWILFSLLGCGGVEESGTVEDEAVAVIPPCQVPLDDICPEADFTFLFADDNVSPDEQFAPYGVQCAFYPYLDEDGEIAIEEEESASVGDICSALGGVLKGS